MHRLLTLANLAWTFVYLVMVLLIAWQMNDLKTNMLAQLSTPEAQADWEKWRADTTKPGPVARREPKSTEPPALVLMRDYYGVCLGTALFFSSLLFVVTMLLVRGAFGKIANGEKKG
jgi:hypothetical protein